MTKKLMYAKSGEEQVVWLVWELQNGHPILAVICTTDDDLARYVTPDRKMWLSGRCAVFCERVMTDHLYGAHDTSIMVNLMRRTD